MKKNFSVNIDEKWCKGCALCVNYCPKNILYMGDDFKAHVSDETKCIGCYICEYRCPDFAIFINEKKNDETKTKIINSKK
jgi:2-oxoglutarate ferredoxin oxidoreductase subunit delta